MPGKLRLIPLFLPSLALAVNYQVGPGRTYTQLTGVVNLLNGGDTVFVDGGSTYAAVRFARPGDSIRPVVIRGLRSGIGQRPVISGGVNTVHFSGAHHYVFEGFDVTGGSFRCIFHESDDLTVRDVVVHDCPRHGVLGADVGSGDLLLEYVEVYRCGGGTGDHQIYATTDEVNFPGSVVRIRHCYLHDANGGNNIKSRAERNEIYYNWVEGGYYHELELIGSDPNGVDSGWTPHLKREDSDVLGNVFWRRGLDSNFAVFRIGGDATGESHGRYRFVNNTIIAGTAAVFRCFDSLESVEMHNNVIHRPGGGLNLLRMAAGEAYWTQGRPIIAGSNNWVTSGAANIPVDWIGTVQGADPGFVDFNAGDLRPLGTGPLADAGALSLSSAPGFDFPNPLFPPAFCPPRRAAPAGRMDRPVLGILDIGAYEVGAGSGILPRARSRAWRAPRILLVDGAVGIALENQGALRSLVGRRVEAARRLHLGPEGP